MVMVKSANAPVTAELRLNSTRCIRYVAPLKVELNAGLAEILPRTKRAEYNQLLDSWEGVSDMCQALDDALEIDKETELLVGKSVLEIGFCTGLPAVFALDSGANEVTLHCLDKNQLGLYVRPTLSRNSVPRNMYKFTSGDILRSLGGKKFDVILAPELIHTDAEEFAALHDVLDAALSPNGMILFSGRTYYPHCSGSIQAFLDLVKKRGVFDARLRWTSSRADLAPRQVVQMDRSFR